MTHYLNYWPLAFFLEILVAYFGIVYVTYQNIDKKSARLAILCCRCAIFLPVYSFFMYVSLLSPKAFEGLLIPITIMEGYCFYTFACMVITNLGGPDAAVALLEEKKDTALTACGCCPCYKVHETDPKAFYIRVTWAVWHFFVTRVGLTILATICFYANTDAGIVFSKILSVISAMLLLYGIITFLLFYEKVHEQSKNVFGLGKLVLIKISVGVITMGFLITSFVESGNGGEKNYSDDNTYSADDKLTRAYCAIIMVVFSILSIPYYFVFSVTMRSPGKKVTIPIVEVDTFSSFIGYVWGSWLDIVDQMTLYEDDLTKRLSMASQNEGEKPSTPSEMA